jgi:hypothetical protein
MTAPRMRGVCAALLGLALLTGGPTPGHGAEAHGSRPASHGTEGHVGNTEPLDTAKDWADKTVSGVAYLPQSTPRLGVDATPSLRTVMFQAYLGRDGTARVRSWDAIAKRYTAVDTKPWRGTGDQLCLTVAAFALAEPLCVELHAWGPAFAGTGVNHQAMVKGDIRDGDTLR